MRIVIDDGSRPATPTEIVQGVAVLAAALLLMLLAQACSATAPYGPAGRSTPARTWTVSTGSIVTGGPVMGWDTRCAPAVPPPGRCPDPTVSAPAGAGGGAS